MDKKLSTRFLHWNVDSRGMTEMYSIWIDLDFQTRFSLWVETVLSRYSNSSFSKTTALNFSIKVCFDGVAFKWLLYWTISYFVPYSGILIGRKCKKMQKYSYFPDFQTHDSLNLPASGIPTMAPSIFFLNDGFLRKSKLLQNRSVFSAPHCRKI